MTPCSVMIHCTYHVYSLFSVVEVFALRHQKEGDGYDEKEGDDAKEDEEHDDDVDVDNDQLQAPRIVRKKKDSMTQKSLGKSFQEILTCSTLPVETVEISEGSVQDTSYSRTLGISEILNSVPSGYCTFSNNTHKKSADALKTKLSFLFY